jgi:hypothetical protein
MRHVRCLVALLLIFLPCSPVLGGCPALLMFDGVNIRTQTRPQMARYWGRDVGVQGFFVNNLMGQWENDVGADASSPAWHLARHFQKLYVREGVADNFIKVAIWKRHDWRDAASNRDVAKHFAHAAALARYAGFKGVAMDLEAYVPIWGGSAGGPELSATVQDTGRAIGKAMHRAYPDMTLIVLQDALYWSGHGNHYHGGYGLSRPFLRGLLAAGFKRVVVAIEGPSYAVDADYTTLEANTRSTWLTFIAWNKLPVDDFSVSPGLWPLGHSYTDKSARMSPSKFAAALRRADRAAPEYVWIYGFGSAWQANGPYGHGKVAKQFSSYLRVIQDRNAQCRR